MNRSSRESPKRVRKPSMAVQALQGRPVKDESLEFFSWLKKCPTVLPTETKAGQPGGVQDRRKSKVNGKVETEDLLSTDIGKNEYDWLLTPPAAPGLPSHPKPSLPAKDNPKVRSVSAARPSRLSQESNNSSSNPRLARSSSVTRPSISNTTTRSSISYSIARSSSISNSTRSSIISNSTTRPNSSSNTITPGSTTKSPHNPTKQSPASINSKISSPITRPVSSRLSSPLKTRNPLTTQKPLSDKPKPLSSSSSSSSPSTPKTTTTTTTPRQPTPTRRATSSVTSSTTIPRQPTPTRRATSSVTSSTTIPRQPTPTRRATSSVTPSTTIPRQPTPTRSATSSMTSSVPPVSRSSSLTRLPETKNMRIPKPVERSVSSVKQRLIGASASMSLNRRPATSPVSSPRKNMTRSQFGESLGKSRLSGLSESRKMTRPIENTSRKLVKPVPAIDKTALSRTGSRKIFDPNAKSTDKSIGGSKKAPLYPRSNSSRSSKSRSESASRSGVKIVPTDDQTSHGTSSDRAASDDGSGTSSIRLVQSDTFESSRYDAILLKEDVQNLSWLIGDESVLQSPLFHRFDPPPEPFDI